MPTVFPTHCTPFPPSQYSALVIVKDPMMTNYVKRLVANIAKLLSVILFFASEVSLLETKYLALAIATQATKVLSIEMTCLVPAI